MMNRRRLAAMQRRLEKMTTVLDRFTATARVRDSDDVAPILEDVAANVEAASSALADLLRADEEGKRGSNFIVDRWP